MAQSWSPVLEAIARRQALEQQANEQARADNNRSQDIQRSLAVSTYNERKKKQDEARADAIRNQQMAQTQGFHQDALAHEQAQLEQQRQLRGDALTARSQDQADRIAARADIAKQHDAGLAQRRAELASEAQAKLKQQADAKAAFMDAQDTRNRVATRKAAYLAGFDENEAEKRVHGNLKAGLPTTDAAPKTVDDEGDEGDPGDEGAPGIAGPDNNDQPHRPARPTAGWARPDSGTSDEAPSIGVLDEEGALGDAGETGEAPPVMRDPESDSGTDTSNPQGQGAQGEEGATGDEGDAPTIGLRQAPLAGGNPGMQGDPEEVGHSPGFNAIHSGYRDAQRILDAAHEKTMAGLNAPPVSQSDDDILNEEMSGASIKDQFGGSMPPSGAADNDDGSINASHNPPAIFANPNQNADNSPAGITPFADHQGPDGSVTPPPVMGDESAGHANEAPSITTSSAQPASTGFTTPAEKNAAKAAATGKREDRLKTDQDMRKEHAARTELAAQAKAIADAQKIKEHHDAVEAKTRAIADASLEAQDEAQRAVAEGRNPHDVLDAYKAKAKGKLSPKDMQNPVIMAQLQAIKDADMQKAKEEIKLAPLSQPRLVNPIHEWLNENKPGPHSLEAADAIEALRPQYGPRQKAVQTAPAAPQPQPATKPAGTWQDAAAPLDTLLNKAAPRGGAQTKPAPGPAPKSPTPGWHYEWINDRWKGVQDAVPAGR